MYRYKEMHGCSECQSKRTESTSRVQLLDTDDLLLKGVMTDEKKVVARLVRTFSAHLASFEVFLAQMAAPDRHQ